MQTILLYRRCSNRPHMQGWFSQQNSLNGCVAGRSGELMPMYRRAHAYAGIASMHCLLSVRAGSKPRSAPASFEGESRARHWSVPTHIPINWQAWYPRRSSAFLQFGIRAAHLNPCSLMNVTTTRVRRAGPKPASAEYASFIIWGPLRMVTCTLVEAGFPVG